MYKILYYTKPFHTEILNYIDVSLITSQDVFNNIYFTHFYKSNLFFTQSDSIVLENFQNILSLKPLLENIVPISVLSRQTVKLQLPNLEISFETNILDITNIQTPEEIITSTDSFEISRSSLSSLDIVSLEIETNILDITNIQTPEEIITSTDSFEISSLSLSSLDIVSLEIETNILEFTNHILSEVVITNDSFTQLYAYENLDSFLFGYGSGYGSGYGLYYGGSTSLPLGFYW